MKTDNKYNNQDINSYEEALEMMKDLANQNYLPAIQFLQLIEK